MDIRPRLKKIVSMVPPCKTVADIGTDHGYALISLLKEGKIEIGIASDNKKKPLEKARKNAENEGVVKSLIFRRGNGLETINSGEVNGAILAGMGGQLIKEILENSLQVVKEVDFLLVQPAQNPEVLREYLYTGPYKIIDEDIVREDQRFYEYMMIKFDEHKKEVNQNIVSYRVGHILSLKNHPLFNEFIDFKINQLEVIVDKIKVATENGEKRKNELNKQIDELRRMNNVC